MADVRLEITSSTAVSSSSKSKIFKLHSAVLSTHSNFFFTTLSSPVGSAKRARKENDQCRFWVSEVFEAEEMDEVEQVLEFFYKQVLSNDLSGSQLLLLMKVRSVSQWMSDTVVGSQVKECSQ